MDTSLSSLVRDLLAAKSGTPEWNLTVDRIVERTLRFRRIARVRSRKPLEGIYQQMYEALKKALTEAVREQAVREGARTALSEERLKHLLSQACQNILTYDCLTQLAVHLQQQPFRSVAWQQAMEELFTAVDLSNKLKRPTTYDGGDAHLDITNEALMQAIDDIQKFDPERAHFVGWINQVYIGRRGIDIRNRQQDTLKKAHHRRVMPIKYALGRVFARSASEACRCHLKVYVRCCMSDAKQDACLQLSLVICLLQRHLQDDPIAGNHLLFAIAEAATGRSVEFDSLDVPVRNQEGQGQLKEIASPVPESPPKVDFLRECLQSCGIEGCSEILQKHVKANAKATLRSIALQRIDGRTLKEISQAFDVLIPTVQKFYERNMAKVADCLKLCVDDKIALWEMQHPRA